MRQKLLRLREIGPQIAALMAESAKLRREVIHDAETLGHIIPKGVLHQYCSLLLESDSLDEPPKTVSTVVRLSVSKDGENNVLFEDVPLI